MAEPAPKTADTHLPPVKQKAEFEIQSSVTRDTNRPGTSASFKGKVVAKPEIENPPLLDNLDLLASTQEERFASDGSEEAAVAKARIRRAEEKLVSWEDGEDSGKKQTSPLKRFLTFALTGLVAGLFIGIAIFGIVHSLGDRGADTVPVMNTGAEDEDPASKMSRSDIDASLEAIRMFLEASSLEERLPLCREQDRVAPLMRDHYSIHDDGPVNFREIKKGADLAFFENFLVSRIVKDDFSESVIAVEKTEEGDILVDWESFVAHCEIPWARFMKERPVDSKLVRVALSADTYFNFGFEEDEYDCFRLRSQNGTYTLYGYVPKKSKLLLQIRKQLKQGTNQAPLLTLELAYPEDAKSSNQVHITKLIESGWVIRPGTEERLSVDPALGNASSE